MQHSEVFLHHLLSPWTFLLGWGQHAGRCWAWLGVPDLGGLGCGLAEPHVAGREVAKVASGVWAWQGVETGEEGAGLGKVEGDWGAAEGQLSGVEGGSHWREMRER